MVDYADTIWRDYVTDGVPSSGAHQPKKSDIRVWANGVQGADVAVSMAGARPESTDNTADIQSAVTEVGTKGTGFLKIPEMYKSGTIDFNYSGMPVIGSGVGSGLKVETAVPAIRSLYASRGSVSLTETRFQFLEIDGSDVATKGFDLERFTRGCGIDFTYVHDINGVGIDIYDSWSYTLIAARTKTTTGHGINQGNLNGDNNAFFVAGTHATGAGGTGHAIGDGQAGAVIGTTSEYNVGPNFDFTGRNRVIIGNYYEAHDAAAHPKGQEYCGYLGTTTAPFLDGFFWNYVNGGSNSGAGFSGDGVALRHVKDSFLKATFAESTRHEYAYDETWTCIGNHFWLTSDAHTSVTTSAIIRNLTAAAAGDAAILKGSNAYNNTSRTAGTSVGVRDAIQIKSNGTTGSLYETRLAWDGAYKWRWGKLGSSSNTLAWEDSTGKVFELTATSALFPRVYSNTTASAASLVIGSDGTLSRSTSSSEYKRDVEDVDPAISHRLIDELRPVWYRSTCEMDNPEWSWYSFIAEEVAEIDPRLVSFRTTELVVENEEREIAPASYDDDGNLIREAVFETVPVEKYVPLEKPVPDGIHDRGFIPHLVQVMKDLKRENTELRSMVEALSARLDALEKG